jgi:hypothetical protein
MKKFILFLGFLYLISFFSCQEKNNKESFADIIKNDSSRVQELLDEAALLNKAGAQQNDPCINLSAIDPRDELNATELANFRGLANGNNNDKKSPTVIVSSQAIKQLIGSCPAVKDSLIFYLGKYQKDDDKRIERYRERAGDKSYTHDMLKNYITFAIGSNVPDSIGKFVLSGIYDIGRLCPPPSTGCF